MDPVKLKNHGPEIFVMTHNPNPSQEGYQNSNKPLVEGMPPHIHRPSPGGPHISTGLQPGLQPVPPLFAQPLSQLFQPTATIAKVSKMQGHTDECQHQIF